MGDDGDIWLIPTVIVGMIGYGLWLKYAESDPEEED
jgi:hypothetical protein